MKRNRVRAKRQYKLKARPVGPKRADKRQPARLERADKAPWKGAPC